MSNPPNYGASDPNASPEKPPEQSWSDVIRFPLACIGAVIGAALGAMVVRLAAKSGFYAMPLVGLGAGLGASALARKPGLAFGIIAALVALIGAILTEWWLFPFVADGSLGYFVQHLQDLSGFKILLHVIGVGLAFWLGARR